MNSFEVDSNNEEILLSADVQQVMMEWEKPYMEKSIDLLEPTGTVLEIGFGCGYSATQILKHCPVSYTVIECDPVVIKKAKEWKSNRENITIVEGTWQEKLHGLGIFDQIYFDDFPLNISKDSSKLETGISIIRHQSFIDICIQNHTRVGSRLCWYLNGNPSEIDIGSDTEPFVDKTIHTMNVKIPKSCQYRDINEQKCTIPIITKIRDYDFEYAQQFALKQIMNNLN